MKDHEIRELVNDVTRAAQLWGQTWQIRERIAHVLVPALQKAQEDGELAMVERLTQGPISQEEGEAAKKRGLATLARAKACVELRHMLDILPGQPHYTVTREQIEALVVDLTAL